MSHNYSVVEQSVPIHQNDDTANELAYIDLIRRVSSTKINSKEEIIGNPNAIEAIRRISEGNLPTLCASSKYDEIELTRKLSNAEIGVIEAVRRISGINAALHTIGEHVDASIPIPNASQVNIVVNNGVISVDSFDTTVREWHLLSQDECFRLLDTKISGLSTLEHERRMKKYGLNMITPPPAAPFIVKVFIVMTGGFQIMMFGGSTLCFIVYGLTNGTDIQTLALGVVLFAVVIITGAFQMYQEGKSDKVMAALKALTANTVYAYRDGELCQISADTLVPGDIVKVNGGEKVPADVKVLSSSDLKVNNAPLTGENVDIKLGVDAKHRELYEAKNIARSGCNFTSGNGVCVVFATGDNTFFGSIASSATAIKRPDTLMKHEVHRLIKIMAIVAFTLGIAFFILAFFNGYTWLEAIIFMIGIIVANVPEGLLPQLTVALTLTAQRMFKLGVLVSNLEIIETLGAVDIICSDKTGTLTCNRMTVSHVVYDATIHTTPISPSMEGDTFQNYDHENTHFKALQRIATLNTDAVFLPSSTSEADILKKETKGDASESAIIKFVQPHRDITQFRNACKRICSIPFNSTNKWMLTINEQEGPDKDTLPLLLMVKGAPERVMNMWMRLHLISLLVD